ncbi:MAG: hypothetical protein DRR19_31955 [Candidatus Parabeggiatoa sp. nov. 1]|nr:MAG: hypothetical protein DRR19_31955 [Gammaproteobacteria bacterium]
MTTRTELYRLIDTLPDCELSAVQWFLNYIHSHSDPVLQALSNAPYEDEMITEEEERLVQEAREEVARDEISSWDEVKLRLRGQQ